MAEILSIVSIAAFSLAGVDIVILIILWFKFDMLKIMGDLSGRNEKRSIERMHRDRQAQPASAEACYREFREQSPQPAGQAEANVGTGTSGRPGRNRHKSAPVAYPDAAAGLEETSLLVENTDTGETTVLHVTENLEETCLLEEEDVTPQAFTLVENILMVHTEERI